VFGRSQGAGVTRIVQNLENARMLRKSPQKFAFVGARTQPTREQYALLAEETNGLNRTAGAFKGLEDQADCALHFGVGIKIAVEPDLPRSRSMTRTRSAGQPAAIKSRANHRSRAGFAEIEIDDAHTLGRPTRGDQVTCEPHRDEAAPLIGNFYIAPWGVGARALFRDSSRIRS
jgi:hypothetical protein